MLVEVVKKLKINSVQLKSDCDLAFAAFFSGEWGHIKTCDWVMLQNIIQMSDPSDFSGSDALAMQSTFEIIEVNMN